MVNFAPQQGYVIVVAGPMFSGKCLAAGTEVMLSDGSVKKVEDVQEGDLLMGDDSKGRRVLTTSSGFGPLYKVTPASGEPYVVNGDHVLSLKCCHSLASTHTESRRVRARWLEGHEIKSKSFPVRDYGSIASARVAARQLLSTVVRTAKNETYEITVGEYLKRSKSWRALYKGYAVAVELPERQLPFAPYLVGLWLGDGTTAEAGFTNVDEEIINYLAGAAQEMGLQLKRAGSTHSYRFSSGTQRGPIGRNPFLNFLKDYGLRGDKHIPDDYKLSSRAQRLALLAGLVDSDGHYQQDGHRLEFTLACKRLADDTAFLARTLGFRSQVSRCLKICTNAPGGPKPVVCYRFRISGNGLHEIPTQLQHKQALDHVYRNDRLVGIDVSDGGEGAYHGFTLDGNGRFLLADCTVTHNSTELIRLLVRAEVARKRVGIFKPAVDDRDADDAIVSRHGFSHAAHPIRSPAEILAYVDDYDLFAVDEAQFFDDSLISVVDQLADKGKQVVVAGLDLDFRREPFGPMAELMVRAEFVEKLQAVCHRCGGPAFFTQRLIDGQPAPFEGEIVVIGDLESYEARCRACYERG